ncbi:hypothetical protein [Candidatus Protochlamydia phocaeensis]|uniref:hypothetical protein n=1 Tax=Candidatus Protochlamydia phocaeensis TaxID=1414722 RepID=UPI000838E13C|nr:hypothetical protein [Candidatus Protochlamydia phocaeensis]
MIEFSRPISIREDFVPSPKEPTPFLQSVSSAVFNLCTMGVVFAFRKFYHERTIKELQLKQQELQGTAAGFLKKWEQIETELTTIREEVESEEPANLSNKLNALREKAQVIHFTPDDTLPRSTGEVHNVAQIALLFLGELVKNILTLGMYGVHQEYNLRTRIQRLTDENHYIESKIEQEVIANRYQRFEKQILEINKKFEIKQNLSMARETAAGQAYLEKQSTKERLQSLEKEHRQVEMHLTALKAQTLQLERAKETLERGIQQKSGERDNLRQENAELRHALANHNSQRELAELKNRYRELKNALKRAEDEQNVERVRSLEIQLLGLEQQINTPSDRLQLKLGPIPSKYSKTEEDGPIAGAVGINTADLAEWSPYAQRVNNKKTAADLLKAELDYALDELCRLGSEPEHERLIYFNKSNAIIQGQEFEPNLQAVYRFMALDLIKEAELCPIDSHSYALKLNNQGILVAPTNPERVQSCRINIETGERIPELSIMFKHVDEFTPEVGNVDIPLGIDPTGAKWAYNRLTQEEREHLFHLLMEPLIPDEHAKMIETQEFMKQSNNERVELVRTAYELIFDIGVAIEKRFSIKGIFERQLQTKLNDESYIDALSGLLEEGMPIISPLKKTPKTQEIPADCNDKPPEEPIVPWQPNMGLFGAGQNSLISQFMGPGGFVQAFETAKARYQKLYANLSKEAIGNTNNILYSSNIADTTEHSISIQGLSNQYYSRHELIDGHGCLLSNVLALIMDQNNHLTSAHVQQLKNAMAACLDNADMVSRFGDMILANHNITVTNYQNWLRGQRNVSLNIYNLGDVELNILAWGVLGVRIAVFYPGTRTKLDENGLTIPADPQYCYGPNTKETLFLYNIPGHTYYSLWPKVKKDKLTGEVKEAYTQMEAYASNGSAF